MGAFRPIGTRPPALPKILILVPRCVLHARGVPLLAGSVRRYANILTEWYWLGWHLCEGLAKPKEVFGRCHTDPRNRIMSPFHSSRTQCYDDSNTMANNCKKFPICTAAHTETEEQPVWRHTERAGSTERTSLLGDELGLCRGLGRMSAF